MTGVIGALTIVFWGTSIIREVLYDSPRIYIWNLYTTQLNSLKNILLGVPFSTHQAFASYYNNLHNTFMNIHARFGLIPLITIVNINISRGPENDVLSVNDLNTYKTVNNTIYHCFSLIPFFIH